MRETEEKKRILIVHNYYQIHGGEDTVVAAEMKLLQEHGHFVLLYQRSNEELKKITGAGKLILPFAEIFSIRTFREVTRLIRENRIDIVHVHNTLHRVSPSVYYAAFHCHVPVVQTLHNFRLQCPAGTFYRDGHICEDCMKTGIRTAIQYRCYRGSRLQTFLCVMTTLIHRKLGTYRRLNYICLTEFNRKKLLELNRNGKQIIDPARISVKPNFSWVRQESKEKNRGDYYIYAGRIDALKGMSVLLRAWKMLGESAPELRICGSGPQETAVRRYVEKNHLWQVKLMGMLPEEQALSEIGAAKALILPTQWYEGYPMTMAEAFSMKTPVIASDLGNAGSLIHEGENGWKFRADSPEALAEAVTCCEQLICSGQGEKMLFRAKADQDGTQPEVNYRMLCEIYDKAVENNR